MDAGSFDVWPVALGGRIVEGQENAIVVRGRKLGHQLLHQGSRGLLRLLAEADEEVIKAIPIVFDSGRDEPAAGGSSPFGEQHPRENDRQPPGNSSIGSVEHGSHEVEDSLGEGELGTGSAFSFRVWVL